MEELRRVVLEGEEAARRIVGVELRKTLGRFYILWGSFPVAVSIIYEVAREWAVLGVVPLYVLCFVVVLEIYIGLTFHIFISFYRVATSFLKVKSNKRLGVIVAFYFLSVLTLWFVFGDQLAVVFSASYAAGVAFFTYSVVYSGFTRPRYYDHMALIGFLLLFPLSFVFTYVFEFVRSLMWIYAGVKSLVEGYGGG